MSTQPGAVSGHGAWRPPGSWLAQNVGGGHFEVNSKVPAVEGRFLDCAAADAQCQTPQCFVQTHDARGEALDTVSAATLGEPAASTSGVIDWRRTASAGHLRPRSASRVVPADAAPQAVVAAVAPPKTPPSGAPAPAPSQPARPLLLARSRLPAAGMGAAACRRPTALGPSPLLSSRAFASAASAVAGAIASGRPLPKLPSKVAASVSQGPGAPAAQVAQPVVDAQGANSQGGRASSGQARAAGAAGAASGLDAAAPRAEASERSSVEAMAARLSQVERLNKMQAARLAKQSQELDALRAEVGILRRIAAVAAAEDEVAAGAGGAESSPLAAPVRCHTAQELGAVCAERDRLERQVEEMMRFLEDYGLTWVGDTGSEAEASEATAGGTEADACSQHTSTPPAEAAAPRQRPTSAPKVQSPTAKAGGLSPAHASSKCKATDVVSVDVQSMMSRVEALNAMVEKASAKIVSSRVGGAVHARLVVDDAMPLPLVFFRDGVKLGGLPFQGYDSKHSQMLIRDILDGYFPYALKDSYPDGVAMKVVDRVALGFDVWLRERSEGDPELTDGGDRLLPAGGRVLHQGKHGGARSCSFSAAALAQEQEQQEQQRLRAGNAEHRGASAPAAGATYRASHEEVSLIEKDRDPAMPVARLLVKLEGGQRVILLMEPEQTIGALRKGLEQWITEQGGTGCAGNDVLSLRSAFPPKTYEDNSETLVQAGLTPNATLFAAGHW